MTMSRTLKIALLAGFVSLVDPEAAIESAGTDSFSIVSSAEASGRASADPGQRGRRGPPNDAALCGRRIQLLKAPAP